MAWLRFSTIQVLPSKRRTSGANSKAASTKRSARPTTPSSSLKSTFGAGRSGGIERQKADAARQVACRAR